MTIITKRVITDLARTAPYLVRWTLPLPLGYSLKLHQIMRADDDRCSHDHPWPFLRIILKGGYTERHGDGNVSTRKPWRPWSPWRLYYCPAHFRHRILELTSGPSWTLVVCGRRARDWGFYTRTGWMQWREFVEAAWSKRVLWCDDGSTLDNATIENIRWCPKCGYPEKNGVCDGCDPRNGQPIRSEATA